ncbi:uncharacterized protein [Centruroides vittatus]|uniref:uncharacterized protein n=1 Tax=Centruroides vittatus TaxID=120091 RepID=UPI00350ECF0D
MTGGIENLNPQNDPAFQNLAFRGHRENLISDSGSGETSGNFIDLVKLIVRFDSMLRLRLKQVTDKTINGNISAKRQLKADAVPNVFFWSKKEAPSVASRRARREHRKREVRDNRDACYIMDTSTLEIGGEVIIDEEEEKATCPIENNVASTMVCVTTQIHTFEAQCQLKDLSLTTMLYVTILVPNQLFLTLIKLRLNTANFELSRMYSVSEETVRNVFITWINFMYLQWRELDIWNERSLVDIYMPRDFKMKFPNTRVIIDSLECKISKPKNPVAQQATWSSYKNDNTLKAVVGCTPNGLVSFVSEAYGGSASDRKIAERSTLCKITEARDCVMADRGFNTQDLLITKDVVVNTPTFMRGKAQPSSSSLSRDRKISSKRIHIEPVTEEPLEKIRWGSRCGWNRRLAIGEWPLAGLYEDIEADWTWENLNVGYDIRSSFRREKEIYLSGVA